MEEITVSLFPPAGAGMVTQVDPRTGNQTQQFLPAVIYQKVKELSVMENGQVEFTTRSGDRIQSNLPYVIQTSTVAHDA